MPDGASLPHTSAALVPSSLTSISASDVDKSLCDTTLGSMPWGPGTSQFLGRVEITAFRTLPNIKKCLSIEEKSLK